MPTNFEQPEEADRLAQRIDDISTDCFMAHAIRAAEKYLHETYGFDTQIILRPDRNILTDTGRISWSSVAQNSGHKTYIAFPADPNLDKNHKRFCIAHELYHVIWSIGSASGAVVRNRGTEEICDMFANRLCFLHDKFLETHGANRNAALRFPDLPYKSVE